MHPLPHAAHRPHQRARLIEIIHNLRDPPKPALDVNAGFVAAAQQRVTAVPAQPWNTDREVWLLACLAMPTHLRHGYTLDPTTRTPKAATVSAPDGSWCEIDLTARDNGSRTIREGGPTALWAHVERAYQCWHEWKQPGWERFGLTITTDTQAVWLDRPAQHPPAIRPPLRGST